MAGPLSDQELKAMDAYWRAANYLSVGQIYLYDNPLLKQPLKLEHIKPRAKRCIFALVPPAGETSISWNLSVELAQLKTKTLMEIPLHRVTQQIPCR